MLPACGSALISPTKPAANGVRELGASQRYYCLVRAELLAGQHCSRGRRAAHRAVVLSHRAAGEPAGARAPGRSLRAAPQPHAPIPLRRRHGAWPISAITPLGGRSERSLIVPRSLPQLSTWISHDRSTGLASMHMISTTKALTQGFVASSRQLAVATPRLRVEYRL
jgi:hypothetical protein